MRRDKAFFIEAATLALDRAHKLERAHRKAGGISGPLRTRPTVTLILAEAQSWRHTALAFAHYAQGLPA